GGPPPRRLDKRPSRERRERFWATPCVASSFRCVDRSVRVLGMRHEYVVAEFILPGDEVFLHAFAFDDLVMTFRVAAENPPGFPGRGQNLWRRDLHVVVE